MNTSSKVKWLGGLVGVCVIALGVESYYLWHAEKSGSEQNQANNALTFSAALPKDQNPWSGGWNPGAQFKQMQQQMNALMNQMSAANSMFSQQGFGASSASPRIAMQDEADKYKVIVDVPKGEKVEVNTHLSGNQLTVDGKVKQSSESQSNGSREQALAVSEFSQTMRFPEPVKDSGVKVTHNDNQIVITVPKVG